MELFTKRMSWTVLRDILKEKKEFRNYSKSFRGSTDVPTSISAMGTWLEDGERKRLNEYLSKKLIDYIVWSYNTPLYVHCGGFWIEVEHSQSSKTTTYHRGQTATAVSQL